MVIYANNCALECCCCAGSVARMEIHNSCRRMRDPNNMSSQSSGRFSRGGGNGKGGYSHLFASALSLHIAGLATILLHKCDIPLRVKGQPNCALQLLACTVSALAVGLSHRIVIRSPCACSYPLFAYLSLV